MTEKPEQGKGANAELRRQRAAEALRANLRRRKDQKQQRQQADDTPPEEPVTSS